MSRPPSPKIDRPKAGKELHMKYHKIRNVEKTVCAAEQMIAYNIAFRQHISYQSDFEQVNACDPEAGKSFCEKLARNGLLMFRKGYDYKPGKFDEDAIFYSLNAGLYGYLSKPFIASSYEAIGKAFPASL